MDIALKKRKEKSIRIRKGKKPIEKMRGGEKYEWTPPPPKKSEWEGIEKEKNQKRKWQKGK